jgi:hypothetical protein
MISLAMPAAPFLFGRRLGGTVAAKIQQIPHDHVQHTGGGNGHEGAQNAEQAGPGDEGVGMKRKLTHRGDSPWMPGCDDTR